VEQSSASPAMRLHPGDGDGDGEQPSPNGED
jgi:hypothetical protein